MACFLVPLCLSTLAIAEEIISPPVKIDNAFIPVKTSQDIFDKADFPKLVGNGGLEYSPVSESGSLDFSTTPVSSPTKSEYVTSKSFDPVLLRLIPSRLRRDIWNRIVGETPHQKGYVKHTKEAGISKKYKKETFAEKYAKEAYLREVGLYNFLRKYLVKVARKLFKKYY